MNVFPFKSEDSDDDMLSSEDEIDVEEEQLDKQSIQEMEDLLVGDPDDISFLKSEDELVNYALNPDEQEVGGEEFKVVEAENIPQLYSFEYLNLIHD